MGCAYRLVDKPCCAPLLSVYCLNSFARVRVGCVSAGLLAAGEKYFLSEGTRLE